MTTAATVRSGETVFDHHTTETDDRRASNGRACLSIETPPRKATQRHERPCGDWTRARPPIGRAVGRWPSAPTLHLGNDTTFPTKRSNPRQLITIFLSPHRRRTATRTRRYYRTYVSGTERSPHFTVRSIETVRTPTGRPNADRELPRPTDRPTETPPDNSSPGALGSSAQRADRYGETYDFSSNLREQPINTRKSIRNLPNGKASLLYDPTTAHREGYTVIGSDREQCATRRAVRETRDLSGKLRDRPIDRSELPIGL